MFYHYRVTLSGIKGFFRVYQIKDSNSLYSLHKQLRADLDFPADQLILFKALDENGGVVARYGLFDLGFGTVDQITIAETIKKGIKSFVYFYDVQAKKSVNISFDSEVDKIDPLSSIPGIVESKGPNPIEFENGYVAFEDLPEEQRHLPGEKSEDKPKKNSLEALLNINLDEDLDEDLNDEDLEDDDDEDDDDDEKDNDEDGVEIYDGSEELTL